MSGDERKTALIIWLIRCPLLFDDERIERMDLEYLKYVSEDSRNGFFHYVERRMRPDWNTKTIMVYDAYPDKLQLKLMCTRVCDNIRRHEHICREEDEKEEDLSER